MRAIEVGLAAFAGRLAIMNNRAGRIVLIVIGAIAVIVGAVWVGQGTNLIPGSVMSGSTMWLQIGVIVGVVGIILIVLGLVRRRKVSK